jgi:hypothetical protein
MISSTTGRSRHQRQIELLGGQLLAQRAKHPSDEQVHLLTKQFNFLTQTGVLFAQLLVSLRSCFLLSPFTAFAMGSKIRALSISKKVS